MKSDSYTVSVFDSCEKIPGEVFDQSDIFSSMEWYCLQQTILDTRQFDVQVFTCDDISTKSPCVVFPFYRSDSRYLGLRDEGMISLSNYYSPSYSPPGAAESSTEQLAFVLENAIHRQRTTYMLLCPVDVEDMLWKRVGSLLRLHFWIPFTVHESVNWYHDVNENYAEYFNARPSVVKNTYRRKIKLFNRLENSRIEIIQSADGLQKYIEDYNRVYGNSWKNQEPYDHFIPAFIRLAASRGELRLGLAYIGNVPIAAHLWLVSSGVAHIFKLSYDSEYSRYSPGTLVMCEMLKYVLDVDRVSKIDFLSGDDHYKQDWMTSSRAMKTLYACNLLSAAGSIRAAIHVMKWTKGWALNKAGLVCTFIGLGRARSVT